MTHPGTPPSTGGDPYGRPAESAWGQGQPNPSAQQPPYGGQPPYVGQLPYTGQPPYAGQPPYSGYPPAYGQPYGYGFPPPQRTNGMAIASMVLGILWLYWLGSILALVFGYVAKKQIRERGEGGGGMATAGIVLGWIGVGFFVLLMVVGIASSSGY